MAPRPAYVHPSALSPAEHETYATWTEELDMHISKLGRGLRIGEMLGFIRKRTPVDREAEIMSFFNSIPQQQSLGVGEFIAILRLLAHARTCSTLTRDHIFIQTHPLVLTTPISPASSNPFFATPRVVPATTAVVPPPVPSSILLNGLSDRLDTSKDVNLRDAAAKKKRVPPPSLARVQPSASGSSPVTPKAAGNTNPFRAQPTPESPVQEAKPLRVPPNLPPTPPESTITATALKSPPLPPRPPVVPKQPPPKHVSQLHRKVDDGTQTPTHIKPLHVPALGPTSIDIISSSTSGLVQTDHTGQSNHSSTNKVTPKAIQQAPGTNVASVRGKSVDASVRLLGSSHIGVDAKPLRANPPASAAMVSKSSGSSEDFTLLQKNASDSSLSSLAGMLPRGKRDSAAPPSTKASSAYSAGGGLRGFVYKEEDEESLSRGSTASDPTKNNGVTRSHEGSKGQAPVPPPPRRRPESLYIASDPTTKSQKLLFGANPAAGHPAPFSATSIQSSSPAKQRSHTAPYIGHSRSASVSGSHTGSASLRPLSRQSEGQSRTTLGTQGKTKPLDHFISRGRDVSQEWLEKARAGMMGSAREDRQGLISADEVAYTAKAAEDEEELASDSSDDAETAAKSVHDRRRELERMQTEGEAGWARLS